ncbi:Transposon TX1 uncharacterized 149 kDa protein [Vitis vinifera]|uniref:Transposon TX1 uncharacterized 149 kDa protein n=1 Tax=Vitis vinifera TaxID=29760 RepID=A0A438F012_VITVI|nr:Transposon TX1 uncharacterized 149 kDa protein [Vitis vinifera]
MPLFTEEEISKAIFQMDRDKAPGPDGLLLQYSKTVGMRLRRVLHETIHSTQGAFVQGRQIMDAVLIANEIVDERRRSGEEGIVFKIDFEKAYDHVRWDFLDQVLEKKGFSPKWRKWMSGCLSSVSYAVLVNGSAKGWVKASRGLRQGDPLSPFLFTLVADVLSRMLLRANERNMLEGFKGGRLQTLKSLLLAFRHISGLKVNLDKSNIYGINLDQAHLSRLAETLECKASGWPILYLGLPLGGNPRAVTRFSRCKNREAAKGFFRSGIGEGKRDHLVRWDVVCKPKEIGGLGFGNISLRNLALLRKWLWRYPREGPALSGVFLVYSVCGRKWGKNSVLGRFVVEEPTFGNPISKTI